MWAVSPDDHPTHHPKAPLSQFLFGSEICYCCNECILFIFWWHHLWWHVHWFPAQVACLIVGECRNITYKIVRLGSDFIQLLQMLLPPPSYEELFPPRNVQGENKTYEEIRSRTKEVNFLTCEKSDEINNKIFLPLREDPCRSFFSRVTKWGDEVKLKERKEAVFTGKNRWNYNWFLVQVGHYHGELDHKGRRSGFGRMEDRQRVYRWVYRAVNWNLFTREVWKGKQLRDASIRGEWARDEMEGFGAMIWTSSGTSYTGSWQR